MEGLIDTGIEGLVIHHGRLRSNGIARSRAGDILFVIGGCWLDDCDTTLATPSELLCRIKAVGFNCSPTFKGQYVFAYYERAQNLLVVETDPFGVYPLYLREQERGHLIGSQLKALMLDVADAPDFMYMAEVFRFGHSVSDHSPLAGIRRILPNQRLTIQRGRCCFQDLEPTKFTAYREVTPGVYDELTFTFDRAIRRYFADVTTLGVSLSGGLDSRLSTFAARKQGFRLRAFCTGEAGSLECDIARRVAETAKIPISVHIINRNAFPEWFEKAVWVSEGRCPPEHMHFMSALFSGRYILEPQLHGLAGDAIIGGDFDDLRLIDANEDSVARACRRAMTSFIYWPHDTLKETLSPAMVDAVRGVEAATERNIFRRIGFRGSYEDFLRYRYAFRVSGFTAPCLCSQVLPWVDIVAPYIDPAFISLAASLKRDALANRAAQLAWGLSAYPEVSAWPRLKDGVVIPMNCFASHGYERGLRLLKKKQLFRHYVCRLSGGRVNMAYPETYPAYFQWYRKSRDVRGYVDGILLSERSLDRGLWRREGLRSLLREVRKGRDAWAAVATLLMLEVLFRQLLEHQGPSSSVLPLSRL